MGKEVVNGNISGHWVLKRLMSQLCWQHNKYENHDIAIAMSSSRADPVLPWLVVFKCLYQSHCTGWGYLNV